MTLDRALGPLLSNAATAYYSGMQRRMNRRALSRSTDLLRPPLTGIIHEVSDYMVMGCLMYYLRGEGSLPEVQGTLDCSRKAGATPAAP